MVARELDGKTVLVTGVTGFIGQAVFERLLADVPGANIVVLARTRGAQSAEERIRALLDEPVFSTLRERDGADGVARAFDQRVRVLDGDLTSGLPTDEATTALLGAVDVVIHCAATVSFDPPIDEGFTINLVGAGELYSALVAAGARPHLVHVSTAYVAGVRKGIVHEGPLEHAVDWRVERDAALAARSDVERASRRPAVLHKLQSQAHAEQRRAGPQSVAADTERRRVEWVHRQLVDAGRARAHSLGWPDVYTLTKALGERATEEFAQREGLPLSIVRPSIVESAWRYPYPGWIVGFKMAEPIILAYGRGALPEFTGVADGIIDIIPVDLVAGALVAAAASPPETAAPAYYHVSSGARNPLVFQDLYLWVREYFQRDPLPADERGPAPLPLWSFPGRTRVERMLRQGERAVGVAEKAVDRLPRSERTRALATRVHRQRRRLDFVRRYADLYSAYAEAEVLYPDDATQVLHRSLAGDEAERFGCDSSVIDWRHYLQEIHCPSVTTLLRMGDGARRGEPQPPSPSPSEAPVFAVFDLEGTIVSSNVVEAFVWARLADLPRRAWPGELAALAKDLPALLAADRRDRGEFLRAFYRRYAGADVRALRELVDREVTDLLLRRVAPAAVRQIRAHRAAGHRTVLVTGALDVLVSPLEPLFDELVATSLAVDDVGRATGYLAWPPLVGEARAAWLRRRAADSGVDLAESFGYGDSHSDLPLLEAVGHPVAVNPDTGLYRIARARKWPVANWPHDAGTPSVTLPTATGAR